MLATNTNLYLLNIVPKLHNIKKAFIYKQFRVSITENAQIYPVVNTYELSSNK